MIVEDILTDLAACLCEQIREAGLPDPCFCGVMPGQQVAYDYAGFCDGDKDGLAYARLSLAYPAESAGRVSTRSRNCGAGIGVEIELGVIRQAPTLDDEGNLPSEAEQLASAQLQVADMQAMWQAVACCGSLSHRDYILSQYRPHGPQGGVVGGTFTVMVAV